MTGKPENEKPETPEITEDDPITTSHQLVLPDTTLSYRVTPPRCFGEGPGEG